MKLTAGNRTLLFFGNLAASVFISFSLMGNPLQLPNNTIENRAKRERNLELILKVLPPDMLSEGDKFDVRGRVSFVDRTFKDWLERTGELPPDFDQMPSIPFLPNPLIIDEGGENIPVKTPEQWSEQREWLKTELQRYLTGTIPPPPENMRAEVLSSRNDGEITIQTVELSFGPDHGATLTLELMIPKGDGPFPVLLTQWNHHEWAMVAVRRGYIGCLYAGADVKDDTEKYSEIWSGQFDFTRLMRRAWGASRAVDYLFTLPEVDKDKIAITGHSRNGKTSLMAAAFDERIAACVPSSGGTGSEVPWRYTSFNYDIEDIALLSVARPSWLHPRLRFFIGNEHKLPIDQTSLMALVAPRGLMLSTALSEGASNIWAIEQAFHASRKVYEFLGAPDNIAIASRNGLHSIAARDMEGYIDFFDYIFGRTQIKPENRLFVPYSFDDWLTNSGEKIDLTSYPKAKSSVENSGGLTDWESNKDKVVENIRWILGDEPPGVTNPGPGDLNRGGAGERNVGTFLSRYSGNKTMGVMNVSPYYGFGDQLFGYLYYPLNSEGKIKNRNLPVVIYLHEYDYSKGFNSYHRVEALFQALVNKGFAVFAFDMLGFGNRIEEGTKFYNRYPHWSKMGKMVADAQGAVDALVNMNFIDSSKIVIAGYSLGAAVALFTAAVDDRVAGVASVAGFTPMRSNSLDRGTEGVMKWSHLHGLLPRLGFFVDNESRIPVDFDEVISSVAPRPILIIAPEYDREAHLDDVKECVDRASKVYSFYGADDNISLEVPFDVNRFSPEMINSIAEWLNKKF